MEAARKISECLVSGQINPPTREVFDVVKEIISESFQITILADIEIIAYTKKEEQARVAQLIRELKTKTERGPPTNSILQNITRKIYTHEKLQSGGLRAYSHRLSKEKRRKDNDANISVSYLNPWRYRYTDNCMLSAFYEF